MVNIKKYNYYIIYYLFIFQIHLIKLFKSLYDIIPAVKSNEEIINKINNTQSQVIIKGIIDKEAQVR